MKLENMMFICGDFWTKRNGIMGRSTAASTYKNRGNMTAKTVSDAMTNG